jgi:hypothetical protein
MKHARDDYSRIQDPAGLIPDDEPVFLLRAQDIFAAQAVRDYANALEADLGRKTNVCPPCEAKTRHVIRLARMHAELMDEWLAKKWPDVEPLRPGCSGIAGAADV